MVGGACTHDEDHIRSLTTREVLDYWELSDCKTELLCRRLRWYQSWSAHPESHVQVLLALFGGDMPFEDPLRWPCAVTGLTEWASPWARRVGTDMGEAMRACPDAEELLSRVSESPWLLFEDEEVMMDLQKVDFTRVRSRTHTYEVPPWYHNDELPGPQGGSQEDEEEGLPYVCNLE
eukprot:8016556-Pyramimonas_sp.AAC.1